jgi:hypothetical protein
MTDQDKTPNAWTELLELLFPQEVLEWIVIGGWAGGLIGQRPDPYLVPVDKQNVLLDPGDAESLMIGWNLRTFGNTVGGAMGRAYAVQVWTDQRILRTHILGGTTAYQVIYSLPRHPKSFVLTMTLPQLYPKYPVSKEVT